MKMTFLIARSRSVRKIRSRSTAKPVGCSSGTPKMLASDQESCAAEVPVGTESGTLETMTFQVADDEVTASSSHRPCTPPGLVLSGPAGARLAALERRQVPSKTRGQAAPARAR